MYRILIWLLILVICTNVGVSARTEDPNGTEGTDIAFFNQLKNDLIYASKEGASLIKPVDNAPSLISFMVDARVPMSTPTADLSNIVNNLTSNQLLLAYRAAKDAEAVIYCLLAFTITHL